MDWRRVLKWAALVGGGVLVLLILVGFLVTFTGLYQSWARQLVVSTIEGRLRAEAQVGEVGGNPLYRISVRDLRLTSQGRPLLEAGRFSLSYFLPQVIFGAPLVGVAMDDFRLNVVSTPEEPGLAGLVKPAEPGGRPVTLTGVSLSEGTLIYGGPRKSAYVIEDIDIEAGVDLPATAGGETVVRLRQATFRLRQPEVKVVSLTGTLKHSAQATEVELETAAELPQGSVEADLKAQGRQDEEGNLQGTGRLEVARLALTEPLPLEATGGADLALSGKTLRLSKGELSTGGAATSFTGELRRGDEGLSAELDGRLAVRDLAKLAQRPDLAGEGDIDYEISARQRPGEPLSADISARSRRLGVQGYRFEGASLRAAWRPPVLDIADLSATSPGLASLRASGPYRPGEPLNLSLTASSPDLGALASRLGAKTAASGSLEAEGKLTGTFNSPAAAGSFEGRGLAWGAYRAEQGSGTFEVADLLGARTGEVEATLSELEAKGRRFSQAQLAATLPQEGRLSFSASARQPDGVSYEAAGSATGLGEARTEANLESFQARSGELELRNAEPLPIIVSEQTTELPRVALAEKDGAVSATGSAAFPGPVELSASFEGAPVADLKRLIHVNFPVEGALSGDVTVGGTTGEPRIDADLSLGQGRVSAVSFQRAQAEVDYAAQSAEVSASLTLAPGAQAEVSGEVPVRITLLPPRVEVVSGQALLAQLPRRLLPKLFEELERGGAPEAPEELPEIPGPFRLPGLP